MIIIITLCIFTGAFNIAEAIDNYKKGSYLFCGFDIMLAVLTLFLLVGTMWKLLVC